MIGKYGLSFLFAISLFIGNSIFGQFTYQKRVLEEQYIPNPVFPLQNFSANDNGAYVYNLDMLYDTAYGSRPRRALIVKHDSLGFTLKKRQLFFNEHINPTKLKVIGDSIYLLGTTNRGNSQNEDVFILQLDTALNLLNSRKIEHADGQAYLLYDIARSANNRFILTGRMRNKNQGGPGFSFLFEINNQLQGQRAISLISNQFSYATYGFSRYHWFIGSRRFSFDNNLALVDRDSLSISTAQCLQIEKTDTGFASIFSFRKSGQSYIQSALVAYDRNFRISENIFTVDSFIVSSQSAKMIDSVLVARNNYADTLQSFIYKLAPKDSNNFRFISSQSFAIDDSLNSDMSVSAIGDNSFFVHYQEQRDSTINYIKVIDSLPIRANCINIQFPANPVQSFDTTNFDYHLMQSNPTFSSWFNWQTPPYTVTVKDSVENNEVKPELDALCEHFGCRVFQVIGDGLHCNRDQAVVQVVYTQNPFDPDGSFPNEVYWDDDSTYTGLVRYVNEPDTFEIRGSNVFCRQYERVIVDFDSVRADHVTRGAICFEDEDPGFVTVEVEGLFDALRWSGPQNILNDDSYPIIRQPGDYGYIASSPKGCTVARSIDIPERCPIKYYIPNAITPNGDGKNDFLMGYVLFAESFEFSLFDRWGNELYRTNTSPIEWRSPELEELKVDVYVWKLTYTNRYKANVKSETLVGHITVVK